ncbi:MAG: VIT1/CCC1 transporter family protein [Candidatus Uhrbacteria bacterium]
MIFRRKRLKYTGSIVLGLNDALVELTGALAGFTLALQETRLIAMVGLITGIAAALSMASSEYLSIRIDGNGHSPIRAAIYTGIAYIITVFLLVAPFFICSSYTTALIFTLVTALFIIAGFTYYIAKTNKLSFVQRFFEMVGISFGVALVSFIVGYLIRYLIVLPL